MGEQSGIGSGGLRQRAASASRNTTTVNDFLAAKGLSILVVFLFLLMKLLVS